MSTFKTKGIILKIDKHKAGDFIYTIFTQEYGKIRCNKKVSKREKNLDLGYIINFEIVTKESNSIHKIKNIKIKNEFNREKSSFQRLNNYLILLSVVLNKSPNGVAIPEIINIIEQIHSYDNIDEIKLILAKLKIISIFGELNDNHHNITIQKILKFININNIKQIFKLIGISEFIKKELEKI